MLLEFRVANFRAFAEEQVISFVADKDQTLIDNTVECPESPTGRVIRLAVLYGPNGGGKSTLVQALAALRRLVVDSARWQEGDRIGFIEPFKLDTALRRAPSRFEITFVADWHDPDGGADPRPIRYQYGVALDAERVHEEWLLAYPHGQPQTWFDRSTDGIDFGRHLKGEKKRIKEMTRANALFLSVAAQQSQKQLLPVFRWIREHLIVLGSAASRELGDPTSRRMPIPSEMTTHLLEALDTETRKGLISLLRHADVGIEDIRIERRELDPTSVPAVFPPDLRKLILDQRSHAIDVYTLHRSRDGELVEWTLADESEGTQNLYCLLGPWVQTTVPGQVSCFDELFGNLHPTLALYLIQKFLDVSKANESRGQILLTTHDTNLLDAKLLRRDQIWFAEKNPDGASRLYSLLEYRPRKDEAFEKGYLAGRYGALPFLGEARF